MTLRTPDYSRGNCRLYLADCRDILPHLSGVDAVVTDPPYDLNTASGNKGCFAESYDKVTSPDLQAISSSWNIDEHLPMWDSLLESVSVFCFCSNRQISKLMETAYRLEWNPTLLAWHKYNSVPFCFGTWRQDVEWVLHCKARGGVLNGNAELKSKIKRLPINATEFGHPTEKPLSLITDYVLIGSDDAQTILDPFMGSGTTGVACIRTGRKFIGIEKEPKYFDIAVKRIDRELDQPRLFPTTPEVQLQAELFSEHD